MSGLVSLSRSAVVMPLTTLPGKLTGVANWILPEGNVFEQVEAG